ncbi:acyltransferase [Enterocloster bolteae]|uniref:acyltransferase n=1 Tax=Enterocloster bolteae TaxID=208479 RepID=UPI001A9A50BF|nr:acyltransferase [Enterocloster bolteae]MCB6928838.1 acyltransferase [Enterocloster bolteae]MCQ4758404.1 acyltransferase [Enterocloster bolteae]MDU3288164.1 acyltransferase [Enterocloster bolteae]
MGLGAIINYIKRLYQKAYIREVMQTFKECGTDIYISSNGKIIGAEYIKIGDYFYANDFLRLEAIDIWEGNKYCPQINIGSNVAVGVQCHMGAINEISIGNNVLIGSHVLITDHSHGKVSCEELDIPPNKRMLYSKGKVIIQDNVFIGDGAVIMSGIIIKRNAVIGANSVVTRDVEENTVVGGNPARLIKTLK